MKKIIWCSGPQSSMGFYYEAVSVAACFEFPNHLKTTFYTREEDRLGGVSNEYVLYMNKRCWQGVVGAKLGFIYMHKKNLPAFLKHNFLQADCNVTKKIRLYEADLDLSWKHYEKKTNKIKKYIHDSDLGSTLQEMWEGEEIDNDYCEMVPHGWRGNEADKVPDLFIDMKRENGKMNPFNPDAVTYIRKLFKKHGDEILSMGCVHVYGLGYICTPELWEQVAELSNGSMPKICKYHDMDV